MNQPFVVVAPFAKHVLSALCRLRWQMCSAIQSAYCFLASPAACCNVCMLCAVLSPCSARDAGTALLTSISSPPRGTVKKPGRSERVPRGSKRARDRLARVVAWLLAASSTTQRANALQHILVQPVGGEDAILAALVVEISPVVARELSTLACLPAESRGVVDTSAATPAMQGYREFVSGVVPALAKLARLSAVHSEPGLLPTRLSLAAAHACVDVVSEWPANCGVLADKHLWCVRSHLSDIVVLVLEWAQCSSRRAPHVSVLGALRSRLLCSSLADVQQALRDINDCANDYPAEYFRIDGSTTLGDDSDKRTALALVSLLRWHWRAYAPYVVRGMRPGRGSDACTAVVEQLGTWCDVLAASGPLPDASDEERASDRAGRRSVLRRIGMVLGRVGKRDLVQVGCPLRMPTAVTDAHWLVC